MSPIRRSPFCMAGVHMEEGSTGGQGMDERGNLTSPQAVRGFGHAALHPFLGILAFLDGKTFYSILQGPAKMPDSNPAGDWVGRGRGLNFRGDLES